MAEGLNQWTGYGNLTRDPELRPAGGNQVLNFSVACNERYKDREGSWKERTEFVDCELWGARGAALAGILRKGSSVLVEGSIRTSTYEKNGEKRYKTKVSVRNVILAGGKRDGGERGAYAAPPIAAPDYDDDDPDSQIPF